MPLPAGTADHRRIVVRRNDFPFFCRFAIPWHNNMAIPSSEGRILLIGWLVVWGLSSPSSFGAPPRARGLDPAPTQDVDT